MSFPEDFLIEIKVPAKIMLSGEYAVMKGYPSLSLALQKYVKVSLRAHSKEHSEIHSSLWDQPFLFEKEISPAEKEPLLSSIRSALASKKLSLLFFLFKMIFV